MAVVREDTAIAAADTVSVLSQNSDRVMFGFKVVDDTSAGGGTATFNGDAMTDVPGGASTGTGQTTKAWYRLAPDVVTGDFVEGNGDASHVVGASYSGAEQGAPEDVQVTESAASSSLSETVASGSADDEVVAFIGANFIGGSFTATGSATTRESGTAGGAQAWLGTAPGTAGNVTLGASWPSGTECTIVAFNVGSAGAPQAPVITPSYRQFPKFRLRRAA